MFLSISSHKLTALFNFSNKAKASCLQVVVPAFPDSSSRFKHSKVCFCATWPMDIRKPWSYRTSETTLPKTVSHPTRPQPSATPLSEPPIFPVQFCVINRIYQDTYRLYVRYVFSFKNSSSNVPNIRTSIISDYSLHRLQDSVSCVIRTRSKSKCTVI
jgi:hypothetical protein